MYVEAIFTCNSNSEQTRKIALLLLPNEAGRKERKSKQPDWKDFCSACDG